MCVYIVVFWVDFLRMKGSSSSRILVVVATCLSLCSALSASTLISDDVFGQQVVVVNERRLLQVKKPCPINFENLNYTIITSQCKEPYSEKPCCDAFKEFACPLADDINDLTNECAVTMFTYINTIGNYPRGLFASLCREGKDGLACPAPPPSPSSSLSGHKDNNNKWSRIIKVQLLTLPLVFPLLFVL